MSTNFKINGNKTIEHNKIKAKLGITNKKIHTSFYLEGGVFITPNNESNNFDEIMLDVEKACKRGIKNRLMNSKSFERNFLMNFEVCSDRMKKDKKTYLSFQYHFKQKNNENNSIIDVKQKNLNFFNSLLNDIEVELTNYGIELSKNRKD